MISLTNSSIGHQVQPYNHEQDPYHTHFYHQQRNRSGSNTSYDSGLSGTGSRTWSSIRPGEREREREPFLIIPYSPTDTTSPRTPSEAAVKSHPVGHTKRDSHGTLTSSSSTIEKGDQLPKTLADIQHSQYVKTLQHQKMYERRMQELEQKQGARLNRSQTHYTMDGGGNLDLATAVIALKEVDVGEENDGTFLTSSHLDNSQV